ncbi:MAG: LysE family translocator [Burkholderiales bacterium]
MSLQLWLLYTLAALGLSLSPGPNSLLALTHGALHGVRASIATLVGGSIGFTFIIALSMFGIGALLQASPLALKTLQWAGAAYLAWLGVQVWRSPPLRLSFDQPVQPSNEAACPAPSEGNPSTSEGSPSPPSPGSLFRQGLFAASTNPKGILFFGAFLPQFIEPSGSVMMQFIIMAATFVVIEFFVELALATTAQRVAVWLARVGRTFNRVCGALFVGLALALPWRG